MNRVSAAIDKMNAQIASKNRTPEQLEITRKALDMEPFRIYPISTVEVAGRYEWQTYDGRIDIDLSLSR